jgi:hypothetical protein
VWVENLGGAGSKTTYNKRIRVIKPHPNKKPELTVTFIKTKKVPKCKIFEGTLKRQASEPANADQKR